jgi:accessory secretory protein Asp3
MKSFFVIKWPFDTDQTYNYGSKIRFKDGYVEFSNPQMSPGGKIHTWKSKINYKDNFKALDLPLLKGGAEYQIQVDIKQKPINSIHLQFDFYDAEGQLIANPVFTEMTTNFVVPTGTDHYESSLVNLNNQQAVFNYMVIQPKSEQQAVTVFNGQDKIVLAWNKSATVIENLNVIIRNRVLDSGSYIAGKAHEMKVYVEINGQRILNDSQLEQKVSQIVSDIQQVFQNEQLTNSKSVDVSLIQSSDLTCKKLQQQLITALRDGEE